MWYGNVHLGHSCNFNSPITNAHTTLSALSQLLSKGTLQFHWNLQGRIYLNTEIILFLHSKAYVRLRSCLLHKWKHFGKSLTSILLKRYPAFMLLNTGLEAWLQFQPAAIRARCCTTWDTWAENCSNGIDIVKDRAKSLLGRASQMSHRC